MTLERGIYPDFMIRQMIEKGEIKSSDSIESSAIGASSLDLTIGNKIYLVSGGATPMKGESVETLIELMCNKADLVSYDLSDGRECKLLTDHVYIAELNEYLKLSPNTRGRANPRSTIGRLDVFTRVIANETMQYDNIPINYHGKLYLEIHPSAFNITVRKGYSLSQMRLHSAEDVMEFTLKNSTLKKKMESVPFILDKNNNPIPIKDYNMAEDGLFLSVDLEDDIVAYRAKKDVGKNIDFMKENYYTPEDFWEPVRKNTNGYVTLGKSEFFIMKSKELLAVPLDCAVEIVPHNERLVEARIHYAGYAHPGFGYKSDNMPNGTTLTFEIRPHDVPVSLRDGKLIAKLYYNEMYHSPEVPYHKKSDSKYNDQGLSLPSCFKSFSPR